MTKIKTEQIQKAALDRLALQEYCFKGLSYPLLTISIAYPGLWLEHIYDSVFFAKLDRNKLYLAENAIKVFMEHQTEEGQLPCSIIPATRFDGKRRPDFDYAMSLVPPTSPFLTDDLYFSYTQIQECVSFGSLAFAVYEMNNDIDFLRKAFDCVQKWLAWLKKYRMTTNRGLVEMFCGYDTGHDNSARVLDLGCPRANVVDGKKTFAAVLPPDDNITPIIALDMNCNYYGNLIALSKMAKALGVDDEPFIAQAREVKRKLFEICFDKETCFFYDVDKHGNKRKILASTIFHLFMEGVLDKDEDKELIEELCSRYIFNENHFYTPYPFPSVSVSDSTWKKHTPKNCWGYFTQGLLVFRCTLWMEKYGFTKEFEKVCRSWTDTWEKYFGVVNFGQELDPITGEPSESSEWYSSCMLMYLYCKQRWQ